MQGISDKALKTQYTENKFRYNGGNELQSKEFSDGTGLELYDAQHRMLDPQLGRFGQIDPMADAFNSISTYSYAADNPVATNDPDGMKPRGGPDPMPDNPDQKPGYFRSGIMDGVDASLAESFGRINDQMAQDEAEAKNAQVMTGLIEDMKGMLNGSIPYNNWANDGSFFGHFSNTDVIAGFFNATWVGQATGISSSPALSLDGFNIGYTATSTGNSTSVFFSSEQVAELLAQVASMMGGGGTTKAESGGALTGLSIGVSLTDLTTITPMENAAKYVAGSVYGIKNFSKAKSVLGTAEKFGRISKGL